MEQTTAPREQINIAIKLPAPLQERLMTFPMLHLLREAYPDAVLHFICPKHKIEMLYTLPFEGFWYPWDEEEIQNIFDTHRYATQLKIPRVDIFICLGDTLKELALGKLLDAKKCIGFSEGWKNWFTTLAVKRPVGHHLSEEYYALFKEFTNRRLPEKMQVKSRELSAFYQTERPYLAVDLWPFSPGKIDEFWQPYFEMHEGKHFVLFFGEDEAKGCLLAQGFMQRLSTKNTYELFVSADWIELAKMLAHAKGLVARAGASVSFATYLGTDALAIYETGEPRRDAPIPFFANWQILDLRDPTLSVSKPATGVVKPRLLVDPVVLFEKTAQMFFF